MSGQSFVSRRSTEGRSVMTISLHKNSAAVRTAVRPRTVALAGAAAALAAGLVVAVAADAGTSLTRDDVAGVRAAEPTHVEVPAAESGAQAPVPVEDTPVPAAEAPVVAEAGSPADAAPGRSPSDGHAPTPLRDMSVVVFEPAEPAWAHVPAPAPAPQASPEPTGGIG